MAQSQIFLEQLLAILVGLADTFVISFISEAAVSGVSLVNSFNTIFIFLFTVLASGGEVIISQYIGSKKMAEAGGRKCDGGVCDMPSDFGIYSVLIWEDSKKRHSCFA